MLNIKVVTLFKQEGPSYKKKYVNAPSFLWSMAQWLEQPDQLINLT